MAFLLLSTACWIGPFQSLHAQDKEAKDVSSTKQTLDQIRLSMLTGGTSEAKAAADQLKSIQPDVLPQTEKELWYRLAREAALRLGDRAWLESMNGFKDAFDTEMIYRILTVSGQLEKGDIPGAKRTLDELPDYSHMNEREKRRIDALRARIAQLEGDKAVERENIEKLVDHLYLWPTEKCQSCHSSPAAPKALTGVPIQRLWFGNRFIELMREDSSAERVRNEAEADLAKDKTDDRARIRLAFAEAALGKSETSKKLLLELPWFEADGRDLKKPRMLTTFP